MPVHAIFRAMHVALILLVMSSAVVSVYGQVRQSHGLTVDELRCEVVDSSKRTVRIVFACSPKCDGEASVKLSPAALTSVWDVEGTRRWVSALGSVTGVWDVVLPGDGYHYLGSIVVNIHRPHAENAAQHEVAVSVPLYAMIKDGRIERLEQQADVRYTVAPLTVVAGANIKSRAERKPASVPQQIAVNVSGRIVVRDRNNLVKGVPDVKVHFDWDSDENPGTSYHPEYIPAYPGASVDEFTMTDDDGNFHFVRTALSEYDANEIAKSIRIYADAYNSAAIDEGRQFGVFSNSRTVDIHESTTSITSAGAGNEISAEREIGLFLRYLSRARMFCGDEFGSTPQRITFEYDNDPNTISTFHTNILGHDPKIIFARLEDAWGGYHEYGHYVMWAFGPRINETAPHGHTWLSITTDGGAISEGWAEFYSAATSTYWHRREQPEVREATDEGVIGGVPNGVNQFSDFGQTFVPVNQGTNEAAVACFLYNLWDPLSRHVPNFPGDNEDLGAPRGYPAFEILRALPKMVRKLGGPDVGGTLITRMSPYLTIYKDYGVLPMMNRLYPIAYRYHKGSVNTMHARLTSTPLEHMRSATPTTLTITSGNPSLSRKLKWTDSTEPDQLNYAPENGPLNHYLMNLDENEESGFRIYRKAITVQPWVWDGRERKLDPGYELIAMVPTNTTSYTDATPLGTGRYSYVVVAYKLSDGGMVGVSIPKAEASIIVDRDIAIKRDGGDECFPRLPIPPGTSIRLVSSPEGFVNPTMHWNADNVPSYVTLSGVNTDTLTITNNHIAMSPAATGAPFSVHCDVIDANGTLSSTPYYPPVTPYDSTLRFVHVRTGGAFVADANDLRAYDFIAEPGAQVVSVQRLAVPPQHDSTGYHLAMRAIPFGELGVQSVRLLVLEHPPTTEIVGSATCGFTVLRHDGASMVPDSTDSYGLVELPLVAAEHSATGNAFAALDDVDSLDVSLGATDALGLTFDEPVYTGESTAMEDTLAVSDSSHEGWMRDYMLEVVGTYTPDAGLAPEAALPAFPVAEAVMALSPIRPNPARTAATLEFTVPQDGPVRLCLYDVHGVCVRTLVDGMQARGNHAATIDCTGLASGCYTCALTAAGRCVSRPMIVAH